MQSRMCMEKQLARKPKSAVELVAGSAAVNKENCRRFRLFIMDKKRGLYFLVDSGAEAAEEMEEEGMEEEAMELEAMELEAMELEAMELEAMEQEAMEQEAMEQEAIEQEEMVKEEMKRRLRKSSSSSFWCTTIKMRIPSQKIFALKHCMMSHSKMESLSSTDISIQQLK
ncbi:hypothetical protein X975_13058, partial [Stegodyphus mimosarum]